MFNSPHLFPPLQKASKPTKPVPKAAKNAKPTQKQAQKKPLPKKTPVNAPKKIAKSTSTRRPAAQRISPQQNQRQTKNDQVRGAQQRAQRGQDKATKRHEQQLTQRRANSRRSAPTPVPSSPAPARRSAPRKAPVSRVTQKGVRGGVNKKATVTKTAAGKRVARPIAPKARKNAVLAPVPSRKTQQSPRKQAVRQARATTPRQTTTASNSTRSSTRRTTVATRKAPVRRTVNPQTLKKAVIAKARAAPKKSAQNTQKDVQRLVQAITARAPNVSKLTKQLAAAVGKAPTKRR
jgi:hypothetical protein